MGQAHHQRSGCGTWGRGGGPLGGALGGWIGDALGGSTSKLMENFSEKFGEKAGEKLLDVGGDSLAEKLKPASGRSNAHIAKPFGKAFGKSGPNPTCRISAIGSRIGIAGSPLHNPGSFVYRRRRDSVGRSSRPCLANPAESRCPGQGDGGERTANRGAPPRDAGCASGCAQRTSSRNRQSCL